MPKGRPYVFPDPNDMSPNNPGVIVSSDQVLGLYNQGHPEEEPMQRVVAKVQEWFADKAKSEKWDDVKFAGNQCLLQNDAVAKCKK